MIARIALQHAASALALATLSLSCFGQTAPLIKAGFEENEAGWVTFGGSAKVSITHDAANVKEGKGALQYSYNIAKGEISALLLPTPDGALAKTKSIKFWIKTDHMSPLMVLLQEKDGGRYSSPLMVEQDKWQRVELAPSDFNLMQGPDDPKDPDGKLDMDKVENISIGDFAQFLAQAGPDLGALFNITTGPRNLYLDEFQVTEEALAPNSTSAGEEIKLDNLSRPQISWIAIGKAKLALSSGKPLEGKCLQADYHQGQGKLMGLIKQVAKGGLAGTRGMTFSAASLKPTKLIVQVEEAGGGKYNSMVDLAGGSQAKEIKLVFADFNAADDSKDANNKLDMDQVSQVLFIDISGLVGGEEQDNTLWINNIRVNK